MSCWNVLWKANQCNMNSEYSNSEPIKLSKSSYAILCHKIMFNIFFDDVGIFDTSCDPVILTGELSINHLLYADDIAILSLSSDGLQNSLDKLNVYCYKWHLELNTTKIIIIVFNTTGRLLNRYRFSYDDKILEQVREFEYLGTTLSGSGSLMCVKEKPQNSLTKPIFLW